MPANPHTLMVIYANDAKDWKGKASRYRALAKEFHLKVNKDKLLEKARRAEEKAEAFRLLAEKYKKQLKTDACARARVEKNKRDVAKKVKASK
jgi:predicted ATP-grasp superfamily ATP-dependent carboligase